MTIENRFSIPFIASLALKEKQIQQNYRPVIAVHKWFARRPGTLYRGLLLSEFIDQPVENTYYLSHEFPGKMVADPFMGGGTPLVEANRTGCDVVGFDINPMAAWIVNEEIRYLDVNAYQQEASRLLLSLEKRIGNLYLTDCVYYGDKDVPVKYFLWVKTAKCEGCGSDVDLFPGYLIADNTRHPNNVLVCSSCGELNEVADLKHPGNCSCCRKELSVAGPAKRSKCTCPQCGETTRYPRPELGAPGHRLFAIEYINPDKKARHKGRFFKKPDAKDLQRAAEAEALWKAVDKIYTPDQKIPPGDETNRLHRWGYQRYSDLFNARQLLGLELSCQLIGAQEDQRIKRALATNLSDLLRYQNMLCRYDTMALKSLDIFSVHGFPVGLVQCESNLLGIVSPTGGNVGSGGWTNIIEKYTKAKRYCEDPFEVQHQGARKVQVPIKGEWIGENRSGARSRSVDIRCESSTDVELAPGSLDAVFTDPPYFGNVQYAELMDFCFAWLRRLVPSEINGFERLSTRAKDELTVNTTEGRDLAHFTDGLSRVFKRMAVALKPGAPFAFTYHHNKLEAYIPIGVAILDSGLTCSASLPCPAEMGGSIHIHGTGSSILDTVFVSRLNGEAPRKYMFRNIAELIAVVKDDLGQLRLAGVKPTQGDIRCLTFGHLTRMAIWNLRQTWDENATPDTKVEAFRAALDGFGSPGDVIDALTGASDIKAAAPSVGLPLFHREDRDAVSF